MVFDLIDDPYTVGAADDPYTAPGDAPIDFILVDVSELLALYREERDASAGEA